MKKKLVEQSNIESFICQANGAIYVDSTMILTPGAKDELSKRKIRTVRDAKPAACCGGYHACPARLCDGVAEDADFERLFYGVAAMVKEEYGIEDPEKLKEISHQIVQTLKKL
ncbi:hypothetical protein [Desulfosediminicola ganghwensis]|uniref:hypothetical protein n=1 Tax=Desulfosediminicola ganghwensis TaxID=2569540 RepID=UPI0010AD8F05|nr:hypothetical protein [Desulfosediminicola ganghwensis]